MSYSYGEAMVDVAAKSGRGDDTQVGCLLGQLPPAMTLALRHALQKTLVNVVAQVRDQRRELDSVVELLLDEDIGSW